MIVIHPPRTTPGGGGGDGGPRPIPPLRPRQILQPTRYILTGADGSTWDLTNNPNVWLLEGVRGLVPPDAQHLYRTAPAMDGAVHRGHQFTGPQEVVLPVMVEAAPGVPFINLDGALWGALSPGAECRITAVPANGVSRWRPLWFRGVGDLEFEQDAPNRGWQQYPLTFEAPDPFWRGPYTPTGFEPEPNFPTVWAPAGGVMNLAPVTSSASTVMRNDGDVPSWAKVVATGPMDGFVVSVGDSVFEYGAIAAGVTVYVDTHPSMQTVGHATGQNSEAAWAGVKRRRFAPIPARSGSAVSIEAKNMREPGSLSVEIPQLFWRPWGRPQ